MDFFKQDLAPISSEAWGEINETAMDVLKSTLSARKALHVTGPLGLDAKNISTGRMDLLKGKGNVKSGIYQIKPLIESRVNFTLDRWELDNIIRGAKDIDLDALEDAVKELALFEEQAVYYGHKDANIEGLVDLAGTKQTLPLESAELFDALSEAQLTIKNAYADGPLSLIVGKKVYKALQKAHGGRLLIDLVASLIGGSIIYSSVLEGALLVPQDHEDLGLVIGQDYKIGFQSATQKDVNLFIMNSFTTQILDPDIVVYFEV